MFPESKVSTAAVKAAGHGVLLAPVSTVTRRPAGKVAMTVSLMAIAVKVWSRVDARDQEILQDQDACAIRESLSKTW